MKEITLAGIKPNKVDSHGDMYSEDCLKKLLNNTEDTEPNNLEIALEARKQLRVQHAIQFRYNKVRLAINNPDNKEAFKVWNEFICSIQNKETAFKLGYFWVVDDADILSASVVL